MLSEINKLSCVIGLRVMLILIIASYSISTYGQSEIHFDKFNRLKKWSYSDNLTISYNYDKLGNRIGYTIISEQCPKLVTNVTNTDFGSLRHNVECASAGDTILFASVMQNQSIELEIPVIEVDKELFIIAPIEFNITLSNRDTDNTQVLLDITDDLYIEGLKLIGKTEESMILHISPGGSLQFKETEIEKVDIRRD